jgi:GTPase SAR1 family protein
MLVGNKIDLAHERTVTRAMGEMKAQSHGWMFDETSALLNSNVSESFSRLISVCRQDLESQPKKPASRTGCSLQ